MCTPECRSRFVLAGLAISCLAGASRGATPGFVQDFTAAGVAGFQGGAVESNPGAGGVGGGADGFLRVATSANSNLGVFTNASQFTGNYPASGVGGISFWVNDVGVVNPDLELHIGMGVPVNTAGTNYWQFNFGARPTAGVWTKVYINLTNVNPAQWTLTHGAGTLAGALADVRRIDFRHDKAPYALLPDTIFADVGIDRIRVHPVCPGETDGDDAVGFSDLNNCLSNFGASGGVNTPGDVNNDGLVDFGDLNTILTNFGRVCTP